MSLKPSPLTEVTSPCGSRVRVLLAHGPALWLGPCSLPFAQVTPPESPGGGGAWSWPPHPARAGGDAADSGSLRKLCKIGKDVLSSL